MRIHGEPIRLDEYDMLYGKLDAARQALEWALDPNSVKSPYDSIKSIQGEQASCLDEYHPPQF